MADTAFKQDMPNPSEREHESRMFDAIWNVIKSWDVNVPDYYDGYCGATGSHVKLILDGIAEETKDSPLVRELLQKFEERGWDPDEFPNDQLLLLTRVMAMGGHSGSSAEWTIAAFNELVGAHRGD